MTARGPLSLSIDRLVVEGAAFAPGEAAVFERALATEFAHLAAERPAGAFAAGRAAPVARAELPAGEGGAAALGRRTAAALHQALERMS